MTPTPLNPESPKPSVGLRGINWLVLLLAIFGPTILTVLLAAADTTVAAIMAVVGGCFSAISATALLAPRFGKTVATRAFFAVLFLIGFAVACVTMNFFGCTAFVWKSH